MSDIEFSEMAQIAAAAFKAASWRWTVRDGKGVEPYIPGADEIAKSLRDRVHSLMEWEWGYRSRCGRLMVERDETCGDVHFYLDLGTIEDVFDGPYVEPEEAPDAR